MDKGAQLFATSLSAQNHDSVDLRLPLCRLRIERKSWLPIPHELQVVIPRVEIRERIWEKDGVRREREIILSSVTAVSAPRREQSPDGNP